MLKFFGYRLFSDIEFKNIVKKVDKLEKDREYFLQRYEYALSKHNNLVTRINMHGGEDLFRNASYVLSQDDIKTLISLCHPDKHNGKDSAHRMTSKLLNIRK